MAQINLQGDEVDLAEPMLVEGFPGIGLVGKIATDHIVDELGMRYYASVHCDGLPRVGVYRDGDPTVRPPVRLYVSEADNLFALQSDAPITARAVGSVADCVTDWLVDHGVTPLLLSGIPAEKDGVPEMYGIATGDASGLLEAHDVDGPTEDGVVSGPTGALLERAAQLDLDGVGLVVQSSPKFPDPEAARVLIDRGIGPITDVSVDVSGLVEHAEEIRQQREQLAKRMQDVGEEEASQAQPLRMYQ